MRARLAVGAALSPRLAGLVLLCAAVPPLALACGSSSGEETVVAPAAGTGPPAATTAEGSSQDGQCPNVLDPGEEVDDGSVRNERVDAAVADVPELTALSAALEASGLDLILRASRGVTVLAPLDDAFATAVSARELDTLLLRRPDELRTLLEGHVVEGRYSLDELVDARRVRTLDGGRLGFTTESEEVRVAGEATVVCGDLEVANATIHIVDDVLGR